MVRFDDAGDDPDDDLDISGRRTRRPIARKRKRPPSRPRDIRRPSGDPLWFASTTQATILTTTSTYLVDVPAAQSRESESGHRADLVTFGAHREILYGSLRRRRRRS